MLEPPVFEEIHEGVRDDALEFGVFWDAEGPRPQPLIDIYITMYNRDSADLHDSPERSILKGVTNDDTFDRCPCENEWGHAPL